MRFDLKEVFRRSRLFVVGLRTGVGKSHSSSISGVDLGMRGWSSAQSSEGVKERGLDLRAEADRDPAREVRPPSGVGGLPIERSECSSSSMDGMDSVEADRDDIRVSGYVSTLSTLPSATGSEGSIRISMDLWLP